MSNDPNNDAAALAASKSKDASTGGTVGTKHKKLIIFLILVLFLLIPFAGFLVLQYTNKMDSIKIPYISE